MGWKSLGFSSSNNGCCGEPGVGAGWVKEGRGESAAQCQSPSRVWGC